MSVNNRTVTVNSVKTETVFRSSEEGFTGDGEGDGDCWTMDSEKDEKVMQLIKQFLIRDKDTNNRRIDYSKLLAYLDDNDTKNNETSLYALCMMSNGEGDENVLKLNENAKLLPVFLGHAGVFDNCVTRRRMSARYNLPSNVFYSFWSYCITDHKVRRFLCECYVTLYEKSLRKTPKTESKSKRAESSQPPCCQLCPCERKGLDTLCSEESGYFSQYWGSLNHSSMAEIESLTEKMIIIADTVRNVSVDTENAAFMAKNPTFLRYLLLNMNCSDLYLRTTALEILNNVAPFMNVAEPEKHPIIHHFLSFVSRGLHSKSPLMQMKCFITLGGWYTIRDNPAAKRAATKNYSSLNKFEDFNLSSVSPALHYYIAEKDIVSVDIIVQCLVNISSHGKRGCDELCNKVDEIVKTIVAICTPDLEYDWEVTNAKNHKNLQTYSLLKMNTYKNMNLSTPSSRRAIKCPRLMPPPAVPPIIVSTDYCIVDTSVPGSSPQIVDVIPNIASKFDNIPQGYAKFPKNHKFLPDDEECFGMCFEKFEEKLRMKACSILKNIAKCSVVGRKMILQYDTRLMYQALKSFSVPQATIEDLLKTVGSKHIIQQPKPDSGLIDSNNCK